MKPTPTVTQYQNVEPYVTKDGSLIRELMHPSQHGNVNQSLAEAIVATGSETDLHIHHVTEELYYITQGCGMMKLGIDAFPVQTGDTILIPPNTPHSIKNTGTDELKILCCCSPAYAHDDTQLIED